MVDRSYINDIRGAASLQASSSRMLFGVPVGASPPYTGVFLDATESRDVIGEVTFSARGLIPPPVTGSPTEYFGGDLDWHDDGPGGGGFATTESSLTSFTVDGTMNGLHKRLTSASAVSVTLSGTADVNDRTAFTAGPGTVTVSCGSGATYRLPKVDNPGSAGRTASFQVVTYVEFYVLRNVGGSSAEWEVLGDTNHEQDVSGPVDFNGQQVFGHLRSWLTAGGSLTVLEHSGRGIITSSNIVIPTTAGFNCILKAGGAHTVSFNSLTSAAMATGDIMTVEVQSSTVINAVRTTAANLVAFT